MAPAEGLPEGRAAGENPCTIGVRLYADGVAVAM